MKKYIASLISILMTVVIFSVVAFSQTTEFTFQGSLKDNAVAANGNYDFEFALFDALSAGSQIGATIPKNNVLVTNGIFSVKLDFGSVFPGANRYLEVRVRLVGQPGITTLSPRQLVNSAPYSVKSLNADNATNATNAVNATTATNATVATTATNATQLNGQEASFYQNASNLTAGTLSNSRLPIPLLLSGTAPQIIRAETNTNIPGSYAIFGLGTGTTGEFYGVLGQSSSTLGYGVYGQTLASSGPTIGVIGETFSTSGKGVIGVSYGNTGTTVGVQGSILSPNGYAGYFTGPAGSRNYFERSVGIGTTAPNFKLHVVGQDVRIEGDNTGIFPRYSLNFTGGAADAKKWQNYAATDALIFSGINDAESVENRWMQVTRSGLTTTGIQFPNGNVTIGSSVLTPDRLGVNGTVSLLLGTGGTTQLCQNGAFQISTCGSSNRYKNNVADLIPGLDVINRLRPVSFTWKANDKPDIGFIAEEVAAVEPLLVTHNSKGEIEGVKYDRISVVLVNVVKEQQAQIETQQKQIEALTQALCSLKPDLDVCKQKEQ